MSRTLIYNAVLIGGTGAPGHRGWLMIEGDVVAASGSGAPEPSIMADERVDAEGAYLIPGLIDTHVHFREPGLTEKGTIAGESLAAVAGGITEVFDMPNTVPPTTTAALVEAKEALAHASGCLTRYHALMGLVPGNSAQLRLLDPDTTYAVKLFLGTTTGAMSAPGRAETEEAFRICADLGYPIIVHAEDNAVIDANLRAALAARQCTAAELDAVYYHHRIRSAEACLRSSAAAVELAERFGTRLHIAHVSTAREVRELLSEGPVAGKLVTAETTPMYLDPVLADEAARTVYHKINPAIKTAEDAEVLRGALLTGAIDTIGTDHAPHRRQDKLAPGLTAASGAPSVQFALPLMLTYLPLTLIVNKMHAGPVEAFKLRYDSPYGLEPGARADLTLVKECDPYTISDTDVLSPCGWTPFAGRQVHHRILRTYVAGRPHIF